MTEAQLLNKVESFLKSLYPDTWYIKYWGGGKFTKAGIPDLLCCINGRFLAVELKTEKGKVSVLQKWNIQQIKDAGGVAIVLRPSGFEKFKREVINGELWKRGD